MPIPFSILLGSALLGGNCNRKDGNKGTTLETFCEGHFAFVGCKDGMVSSHANTVTWPKLRPALTHKDIARDDSFTTKFFHAEATTS
jgi:hypothetical protein